MEKFNAKLNIVLNEKNVNFSILNKMWKINKMYARALYTMSEFSTLSVTYI
jgi:hypothetical protein